MVSDKVFNTDGTQKIFSSDFAIISEDHLRVFLDTVLVSRDDYDLINNAAVFFTPPATGQALVVQVGTTAGEMLSAPTDIGIVATSITNVNQVANNIANVLAVDANSANVTIVSTNIADVNTVATDIANVNAAVANEANIDAAVANSTNINSAVANASNINAAVANETNINLAVANATDIDAAVANEANITAVADNATNINSAVSNATNINAAVANATNINTVVANATDITTVATNVSSVNTVAGIGSAGLAGIVANETNINLVGTDIANVNTTAGSITNVNTVAGNIAAVNTVSSNITKVVKVADDLLETISEIETVALDLQEATSEIETVAASVGNVDTVGAAITNVNTVASDIANVNTTATNVANVNTTAGSIANVNTTATNIADVNTVATNITDVNAVASNATNINAVEGNETNINSAVSNASNINAAVANASNINSAVSNATNINTAVSELTAINNYADTYSSSATAPSSPSTGDLWFDSASEMMKVYSTSGWQNAGSSVNGIENSTEQTATSGQTSFPVTYDPGYVQVFLNGIRLDTTDYTATDGANIVLTSGAGVGDTFFAQSFGTFALADHYSKTASDSRYLGLAGGTMTGDVSLGDNVKAKFGAGNDLQIYHDGSHSYIEDAGTGSIKIKVGDFRVENASGNNLIKGVGDVATLHHAGTEKLATTSTGIDVTGSVKLNGTEALSYAGGITKLAGAGTWIDIGDSNDTTIRLLNSGSPILVATSTGIDVTGSVTCDGANVEIPDNASAPVSIQQGGNTYFKINTTNTTETVELGNSTTKPDILLGSGNVGIGTTTPSSPKFSGSASGILELKGSKPSINVQESDYTDAHFNMSMSGGNAYLGATGTGNLILATGGSTWTERMRIDSAGIVTMPNQPAFSLRSSALLTGPGVIPFTIEDVDVGNNCSAGVFTAPVTGKYYFHYHNNHDIGASSSSGALYADFQKNGASFNHRMYTNFNGGWEELSGSVIYNLVANDTVRVYLASSHRADAGGYSSFNGYLIG